mmetsp:Transcript_28895/g.94466  ORF Transcript_28895/g.94466 Transcript_28895/m.94466 type:complete len:95 (+) Transcript_28895:52-336(+)
MVASMYVRVKRLKTTMFMHVEPSETVLELKQKIQSLTEKSVEDQRLMLDTVVLDDAKPLAEMKVENDCVLALTYRIPDSDDFEPVEISAPEAEE